MTSAGHDITAEQADEKGPSASLARSRLPAAYSEYASVAASSPPSIWALLIGLLRVLAACGTGHVLLLAERRYRPIKNGQMLGGD
jgi:hypothetical protein